MLFLIFSFTFYLILCFKLFSMLDDAKIVPSRTATYKVLYLSMQILMETLFSLSSLCYVFQLKDFHDAVQQKTGHKPILNCCKKDVSTSLISVHETCKSQVYRKGKLHAGLVWFASPWRAYWRYRPKSNIGFTCFNNWDVIHGPCEGQRRASVLLYAAYEALSVCPRLCYTVNYQIPELMEQCRQFYTTIPKYLANYLVLPGKSSENFEENSVERVFL